MIALKSLIRPLAGLAVAAALAVPLLTPTPANAWWARGGWGWGGWGWRGPVVVAPRVYVGPPVYYAPPPVVYAPPPVAYAPLPRQGPVWIPGFWNGPTWVPGHYG